MFYVEVPYISLSIPIIQSDWQFCCAMGGLSHQRDSLPVRSFFPPCGIPRFASFRADAFYRRTPQLPPLRFRNAAQRSRDLRESPGCNGNVPSPANGEILPACGRQDDVKVWRGRPRLSAYLLCPFSGLPAHHNSLLVGDRPSSPACAHGDQAANSPAVERGAAAARFPPPPSYIHIIPKAFTTAEPDRL